MPGRHPRRLGAALLLATGLLLPGCRQDRDPPPNQGFPLGRLITKRGVRCVPDRRWNRREGPWSFRGSAAVGCWLGDPPPGALRFDLVPAAGRSFCLRLSWDGETVLAATTVTGERVVEIPAGRRTPGAHTLLAQSCAGSGRKAETRPAFDRLAVDDGSGAPEVVGSDSAVRDAYLADFLVYGAAGLGRQRRDGMAADGPGSFEVDAAGRSGATLQLDAQNVSPAPARFVAEAGRSRTAVMVAAGTTRSLRLALPRGARRLRLSVEGAENGVFLFGAPRWAPPPRSGDSPPRRPRLVVLVTLDTTRRDALGVYGAPPEATPNLDALAREATVFEHAVSTTSWTLPAHASMFTGLYPSQHRAGVQAPWLAPASGTLAARLRRAGYLTAGFAGGVLMSHKLGVGQGFAVYTDPAGFRTKGSHLTRQAIRLVDDAAGQDLFLFANYFDAHMPYTLRPSFSRRLGVPAAKEGLPPGLWRDAAAGNAEALVALARGEGEVTPAGRTWLRAAYLSEVAYVDQQVGRLFGALKARGLWDDALVAVVADHGEMLGEDGLLAHSYRLTPELVDVPLIVKWPGQTEGRRDPRLVSVVDLYPTILAAAGVDVPPREGFDLAGKPRRSVALFEEHASLVHPLANRHLYLADHLWGLRQPRRRRVLWEDGERCAERTAAGAWNPVPCAHDRGRILAAILQRLGGPDREAAAMAGEVSEGDREALEALGYL